MTPTEENYKNIPGWGIDADPENEPTYPMKTYTGDDHKRSNYALSFLPCLVLQYHPQA
jgi:hypothetical protein